MQGDDPPIESESNELTELHSQLSALKTSVEQLSTAQNSTTAVLTSVMTAVTTPPQPDSRIESLIKQAVVMTRRLDEIATEVETLVARPTPEAAPPLPSAMKLSEASRNELATTVTEAVVTELTPHVDDAVRRASDRAPAATAVTDQTAREVREVVVELAKTRATAERAISWGYAYRIGVLMVPYIVAATLLMMLVMPVSEILGIGPLSRWAWGAFSGTDSLAMKSWIAVATLAVAGGLGYAIYLGGKRLVESYKAYHYLLKRGDRK